MCLNVTICGVLNNSPRVFGIKGLDLIAQWQKWIFKVFFYALFYSVLFFQQRLVDFVNEIQGIFQVLFSVNMYKLKVDLLKPFI